MSTTLTTQLQEAKTALHKLVTGQMPRVIVDQNGERVEFTMTNIKDLRAYISSLEEQLSGGSIAPRPLRFIF